MYTVCNFVKYMLFLGEISTILILYLIENSSTGIFLISEHDPFILLLVWIF